VKVGTDRRWRQGGRLSPGGQVPDPRSRLAVHRGVRDHSAGARGGVREDPRSEPELQSARGTLREDDQVRMPQPSGLLRGTTAALRPEGIHDALPCRAIPSGPRWSVDRGAGWLGEPE